MLNEDKFKQLAAKAANQHLNETGEILEKQDARVKNLADFAAFATMADRNLKLPYSERKKSSNIRWLAIAGPAIAALVLVVVNYTVTFTLGQRPVQASHEVTVNRPYLFWGSKQFSSKTFTLNQDIVTSQQETRVQLGEGTSFVMAKDTIFNALEDKETLKIKVSQGVFRFRFGDSTKQRMITLPMGHLQITGTTIYLAVEKTATRVFVEEGSAQLLLNGEKVGLKNDSVYTVNSAGYQFQEAKREYLNTIFKLVLPEPGNERKSKPIVRSLKDLRKLGRIMIITTKQGKRYVGVYETSGESTRIITQKRTVKIKTSDIEGVSSYD